MLWISFVVCKYKYPRQRSDELIRTATRKWMKGGQSVCCFNGTLLQLLCKCGQKGRKTIRDTKERITCA